MNVVCPKCSYQRTSTDTAPDWQCPSCGIAYAKFLKPQDGVPRAGPIEKSTRPFQDSADGQPNIPTKKILAAMAFVAAFVAVRYGLSTYHERTAAAKAEQAFEQTKKENAERNAVAKAAPPPVAEEPDVPVDSLKELFASAHEKGEANGLMVVDSGGKSLSPRFNSIKPVKVNVIREDSLVPSGCDRFKVTLMQGGSMESFPNGRTAKSAITMLVAYSLNYCIDGQAPEGGNQIKIEQRS